MPPGRVRPPSRRLPAVRAARPFARAGYWQARAQIYLGCTCGGPLSDLAISFVIAASEADPDPRTRCIVAAVRIESAGRPRPTATAEPLMDDTLAARLLPATIALRSCIGRGSDGWSRPIGPFLTSRPARQHPTPEQARIQHGQKTETNRAYKNDLGR